MLPPDVAGGLLPLSILSVDKVIRDPGHATQLVQRYRGDQYVMAVQLPYPADAATPAAPGATGSGEGSLPGAGPAGGQAGSGQAAGGAAVSASALAATSVGVGGGGGGRTPQWISNLASMLPGHTARSPRLQMSLR